MSRRLANQQHNDSQPPRIPDSRVIFQSGQFRISAVSTNRFVVSIGNLHHTLTGGQAQGMFEALHDHFRKSDGEKTVDWNDVRHFTPDDEATAYRDRMYGGKDDWSK